MRSGVPALVAVALIQSAVLGWMVWERIDLLRSGRAVVLDVVPVDPRDLFRGDYVVLTYQASRLRTDQLEGDGKFARHDKVFVGLRPTETGAWQAFSIHHERPPLQGEVVFLRGTVTAVDPNQATDGECAPVCEVVSVRYGIESYFVPEGEGRKLETLRDDERVQIAARVSDAGEAAIAGLLVDGKLQFEEPLL